MKQIVMSFSLGLLLSTVIIGVVYFIEIDDQAGAETVSEADNGTSNKEEAMKEDEAKSLLEDQGYVVLTSSKYEQFMNLEKDYAQLESENDESLGVGYELVIEQGMGLEEVATKLQSEDIIEDEMKLKEYFRDNDYSRSIQTGSFIVTPNMSFEQIAITITN